MKATRALLVTAGFLCCCAIAGCGEPEPCQLRVLRTEDGRYAVETPGGDVVRNSRHYYRTHAEALRDRLCNATATF